MILMYKDYKGRIWAFTERGNIYQFDADQDKFYTVVDLYSMQKWSSVQALYVTRDEQLIVGMNDGVLCYDLNKRELLAHVAQDYNVRSIVPYGNDILMIGSDQGLLFYQIAARTVVPAEMEKLPIISMQTVGNKLWLGTRGHGLYSMPIGQSARLKPLAGSDGLIINALTYDEDYGLLVGTDGHGLMQLLIDEKVGMPSSDLIPVAYDSEEALYPTKSGAINDVLVDQGNIWFTMYMGGCMRLEPHHKMLTLINPEATSPSDNFVYDLDYGPDGDLWVAFNQAIVRYDADGEAPQVYMNRESRFLTLKVMPDSSVWAGGYGTGLYHFNPETGEKQWYPSVCGAQVNDNIYDLHDSPNGDLWVGGLNMPLTQMHFLQDGSFETKTFPDIQQAFDVESLNEDTLALATSDGFWLLDTQSGAMSHHLKVGPDYEWNGSNFVRCIITRQGREVWVATAGAGLVCYDVKRDHYDYYDSLAWLPSLELRSVLMMNDSMICASTENYGIFSFNCNTRQAERALFVEDDILRQEFLQNSGIRTKSGNLLFGGDRGAVLLTPQDVMTHQMDYWIFLIGPKANGGNYEIGYRNRTLTLRACTNDIYHQDDYKFYYRIEGWIDDWIPFTNGNELRLVNMPSGDWDLELRAVNSTQFELNKTCYLHVNSPIWQRWYAWVFYVLMFLYIVLKIVLHLLRPRIEDM